MGKGEYMKKQINNPIKYCRDCSDELILNKNWTEYRKNHGDYICKSCHNKISKTWSESNPEATKVLVKMWQDTHPKAIKVSKKKFKDSHPDYKKDYRQTSKGKEVLHKALAKRQRNLGWDLLFNNPFPLSIPVEYHHISDVFVVAIPKHIHKRHLGNNHRQELKPIVERIYDITYTIITY